MNEQAQRISDYIDSLNEGKKPQEDERSAESEELRTLYRTVRLVRSLREPSMPDAGFPQRLAHAVIEEAQNGKSTDEGDFAAALPSPPRKRQPSGTRRWRWVIGTATAAALLALLVNFVFPFGSASTVQAMEQAFRNVSAYRGIVDVISTNADGEQTAQARLDVWADRSGRYVAEQTNAAGQRTVTVNNGQQKWQVRPDIEQVHLFPAVPDPYRFQFELGREIADVGSAASVQEIGGEHTVAGRPTTLLEVTPDGGLPYRLWVDRETKLPLQKQTAMQNAVQYTFTYTQFELAETIPEQLLTMQEPENYAIVDADPELIVSDAAEANKIAGFAPATPVSEMADYSLEQMAVVPGRSVVRTYYRSQSQPDVRIVVEQSRASEPLKPASDALIGHTNGNAVEIVPPVAQLAQSGSIRWQQDGFEFAVRGDVPLAEWVAVAESLMGGSLDIPSHEDAPDGAPQIEVPYDIAVERNDQQSVDAGNSPWRLDPVFTAHVFASLLMSPEGIVGEGPLDIDTLELVHNDGKTAIVNVRDDSCPAARVYLERVVRTDETGIWTVVGYDSNT